MDILKNLNHRLTFAEEEASYGGEEEIKNVLSESPIQLPEDYIDFLRQISGGDSLGLEFEVDDMRRGIGIWSAGFALEKREEFDLPIIQDFMQEVWLIGDDGGDFVYFYGKGRNGFGLYKVEAGCMCFEDADKIADTITDFLVKGVGIDVAI